MKILITNDDGIDSPGLCALLAPLAALGEVYVAAPAHEQSTKSQSMTYEPHLVTERELPGAKAAYAVTGTPADSVEVALFGLGLKPDVVISGVNRGFNMAKGVLLSGTVGAARQAFMQGIPALAVSLDSFTAEEFGYPARLTAELLPQYLGSPIARQCFLNINIPCLPESQIKGISWADLALRNTFHRTYREEYREGKRYLVPLDYLEEDHPDEQTPHYDWWGCRNGWVTITPLSLDAQVHAIRGFGRENK